MISPYVGVTGFMSTQEVGTLLGSFPKGSQHQLMVGVLDSSKTLAGKTNKWPGRYPAVTAIRGIFLNHPRALNLVHYSTNTPQTLVQECTQVLQLAGPYCHGLQLNVCWPDPAQIAQLRLTCPRVKLVLQLGGQAMAEESYNPDGIARRLATQYYDLVDGVLFDPSGGLGIGFDPAVAVRFLFAVQQTKLVATFGVAGGLGPETIDLLAPVAAAYPSVSIDAEGRLRTPQPEDALDVRRACRYVQAACAILAQA